MRIAKTWDEVNPVLYDGDEAISTRYLEYNYRRMRELLDFVDAHYSGSLDHQPEYVKLIHEYLELNE